MTMLFYDAHLHQPGAEAGAFLVGLEGLPFFSGTMTNQDVLRLHDPAHKIFSFYYVVKQEVNQNLLHPLLKYHPRREKYTLNQVIESIGKNNPAAVMIDTLNEPFWVPYDYWELARVFPELPVIFPHAGGYLVNDFIKICHFQRNVWIDFSLTHTVLADFGKKPKGLPYIYDAIEYSLHSPFKDRILLGSDNPFYNQEQVVEFYRREGFLDLLNRNFLNLSNQILNRIREKGNIQ